MLFSVGKMKELIRAKVKDSSTLDEVRDNLISLFKEFREKGHARIGYVSGIITSDGKEHMARNIKRLEAYTDKIREEQGFPIFAPTDVFDDVLFKRLDANGFVNEDWMMFWEEVLASEERFVTDMFMTPRWQESKGANDEHRIAKEIGMTIVYIEKETS